MSEAKEKGVSVEVAVDLAGLKKQFAEIAKRDPNKQSQAVRAENLARDSVAGPALIEAAVAAVAEAIQK
jgi:hypothetical protein